MKSLFVAIVIFTGNISFAGGSSGGGGVRPDAFFSNQSGRSGVFGQVPPVDLVKLEELNRNGHVKFSYKPFESKNVYTVIRTKSELQDDYLKALENSAASGKWEAVELK